LVETEWGRLEVWLEGTEVPREGRIWVGIRPEHVGVEANPRERANVVAGRILSALFEGTGMRYRIALGEGKGTLVVYGPPDWRPGETVHLWLDPRRILLLESGSEAMATHSGGGR